MGQFEYNRHVMQDEIIRLTRAQVRELDRLAIEEYGIPGIVLMENAARGVADEAIRMLGGIRQPHVAIFCGTGNNGGDGYAVARHLHNHGISVELLYLDLPASIDAILNLKIAKAMNLDIAPLKEMSTPRGETSALIIDALLGTGLTRPVTGHALSVIESLCGENYSDLPILAVDLPSGLDCDSGEPLGACIRATKTVTFVTEKAGFANPTSREYTGEIIVADIGAPRELIERVRREIRG